MSVRRRLRWRLITPTLVWLAACAACSSMTPAPDRPPGGVYVVDASTAIAQLNALTVADEVNPAYDRKAFGGWIRQDDGCSTRIDVLERDGVGWTRAGCKLSCPVATCWTSSYDGVTTNDPARLQVDHLVPVHEAVQSGAASWDMNVRVQFYNDELNLTAVTVHSNESKGDDDPGEWLPPNAAYVCTYVTRYVDVKSTYHLTVDRRERDVLARALGDC